MASESPREILNELLDGTHPKAARFATFQFLFLGVFYALLGSAAILGYLPSAMAPKCLVISPLCFAAAIAVAARTNRSLFLAFLFSLAAMAAPMAITNFSAWYEHVPDEYAQEMARSTEHGNTPLNWLVWAGLLAAYVGRKDFTHPFNPATFIGLAWEGMRMLTRKDGTALMRLAAGVVVILLGVGLAFALTNYNVLNRGTGRAVVGLVVAGAALAASALTFFPEK